MILSWTPWRDVWPYAQFLGTDRATWTVLPTYPVWPRRAKAADGREWIISPPPDSLAPLLIPTEDEAALILRVALGAELVGQEVADRFWRCPLALERWQLARHLRDFHGRSISSLGDMPEPAVHRLHGGLHQQVIRYPLPVAHIHSGEVRP